MRGIKYSAITVGSISTNINISKYSRMKDVIIIIFEFINLNFFPKNIKIKGDNIIDMVKMLLQNSSKFLQKMAL